LTGNKGFTSIELVVVIVVLGVLAASIIINNPFKIQNYSRIAADQLTADIRSVQLKAMGTRSQKTIAFNVGGDQYTVDGVQRVLPNDTKVTVKITNTSFAGPLTFNSLGEPDKYGTIDLSGGRTAGGETIKIYSSTGRAEIE